MDSIATTASLVAWLSLCGQGGAHEIAPVGRDLRRASSTYGRRRIQHLYGNAQSGHVEVHPEAIQVGRFH